jgi:hypothetical protein
MRRCAAGGGAASVFLSRALAYHDLGPNQRRKNAGQPDVAYAKILMLSSSSAANQNAGCPEIGIPAFILTLVTVSNAF